MSENLPQSIVGKRPTLFYAGRCPKCRFLSALVVATSLNFIRRVPIESDEDYQFYKNYPQAAQKLVIFHDLFGKEGLVIGRSVFVMTPFIILRIWLLLVWYFFRRIQLRSTVK